MDIQSVSSGVSAYLNAAPQNRPPQQSQQVEQAKSVEPKPVRQTQQAAVNEQAPRPVTNTLGQTTGSLISVTA